MLNRLNDDALLISVTNKLSFARYKDDHPLTNVLVYCSILRFSYVKQYESKRNEIQVWFSHDLFSLALYYVLRNITGVSLCLARVMEESAQLKLAFRSRGKRRTPDSRTPRDCKIVRSPGVPFSQSIDSIVFFESSRRNHGKSMENERLMILACTNLIHTKVKEM